MFKTFFLIFVSQLIFGQQTHFELSNFKETVHPNHVMDFYKKLSEKSPYIKIENSGTSDFGTPIYSVIISQKKIFKADNKKDEFVFMIQNGIHSGESCGIDASQLYARYLLEEFEKNKNYQDIIFVIIPVYNIGGHQKFTPYNRVNQNGPTNMGFRGNARNYDLNRDYIKMDTKNMSTFANLFHSWNPHVFLDNHSTDGADYQYAMTYMMNETEYTLEPIRSYVKNTLKPQILSDMDKRGYPAIQYVSLNKRDDIKAGLNYFHLAPRYSTGYAELFNTISILVETHMLKSYEVRVKSNFEFMKSLSSHFSNNLSTIKDIVLKNQKEASHIKTYAITRKLNRENFISLNFKGYEYSNIYNSYANADLVKYDRTKPITMSIPLYMTFEEDKTISVPKAYIIPQQWTEVIDRLIKNNVILTYLDNDKKVNISQYRITNPKWSNGPFEGRQRLSSMTLEIEESIKEFRKGDVIVYLNQPQNVYIMNVLEPEASDSFLKWGFFKIIFQQKEYFDPYSFIEKIPEIIKDDPTIEKRFKAYLDENPAFEKNPYMRLNFFYKNSKYYEKHALNLYPIFRIEGQN